MKSEPESYGIEHLKKDKKTAWTGVRNYQARNFMQQMKKGDTIFFYHSNTKVVGIYGLAEVVSAPYPDPTQFDSKSKYFEPRATKDKPVWYLVDIGFVKQWKTPITLEEMRGNPKLRAMMLLQPGSRLSVTPVDHTHAELLIKLAA